LVKIFWQHDYEYSNRNDIENCNDNFYGLDNRSNDGVNFGKNKLGWQRQGITLNSPLLAPHQQKNKTFLYNFME